MNRLWYATMFFMYLFVGMSLLGYEIVGKGSDPIIIYLSKALLDCELDFDNNPKTCVSTFKTTHLTSVNLYVFLGLLYIVLAIFQLLQMVLYIPMQINLFRYIDNALFFNLSTIFVAMICGIQDIYTLKCSYIILLASDVLLFTYDIIVLFHGRHANMGILMLLSKLLFTSMWIQMTISLIHYGADFSLPWYKIVIPVLHLLLCSIHRLLHYGLLLKWLRPNELYFDALKRNPNLFNTMENIFAVNGFCMKILPPLLYLIGTQKWYINYY